MLLPQHRESACVWTGHHIEALNAQLALLLQACHNSVAPDWRTPDWPPPIQLYAAPLAAGFGLDGICCWPAGQALILLDLGVLEPQHWPALLLHEYAHALSGQPGHHPVFQEILGLLSMAMGLEINGDNWQSLPAYPRRRDRIAFWLGAA